MYNSSVIVGIDDNDNYAVIIISLKKYVFLFSDLTKLV